MSLTGELKQRIERALRAVDDGGVVGTRLLDDARRFCARVRRLVEREVVAADTDSSAMELACMALQLPVKAPRHAPAGRVAARPNLKERAEQAAELLSAFGPETGEDPLIEETSRLLRQVHQRTPESDQARLLSDALNLEDFGICGLLTQAMALARQGGGVMQVADGCEKREQYGYWDARLKDGFHFEQTRQLARKRLEHARKMSALLLSELREDGVL